MQYAIVWQKCYSLAPRKIWTVIWLNRNSVKLAETVGCSTGWGCWRVTRLRLCRLGYSRLKMRSFSGIPNGSSGRASKHVTWFGPR